MIQMITDFSKLCLKNKATDLNILLTFFSNSKTKEEQEFIFNNALLFKKSGESIREAPLDVQLNIY